MHYPIIFFDIDGTLRDEAYGIPPMARTALEQCRAQGHMVCICTGRTAGTIPDDALDLEIDALIAGDGCYIYVGDTELKSAAFAAEDTAAVFEYLQAGRNDIAYTLETKDTVYMNREASAILQEMNARKWAKLESKERERMKTLQRIPCIENIALFRKEEKVSKICLWADRTVYDRICSLLVRHKPQALPGRPFDHRIYWEMIPSGCDKGMAVRELCDHLKISWRDVLAFGDGKNDIALFQAVGSAVAMRTADKEALGYAHTVCEAPMENGIYLELKRRKII